MHQHATARPGHLARVLGALLVLVLVATACTWGGDEEEPIATDAPAAPATAEDPATDRPVRLHLREGEAVAVEEEEVPVVGGSPLEDDRIGSIIDRLPPFAEEEGDRSEFNRPAETLPPPVAGDTVPTTFPPATGATTARPTRRPARWRSCGCSPRARWTSPPA